MKIKLPINVLYYLTEDKEHTFIGEQKDRNVNPTKQFTRTLQTMSLKTVKIQDYPIRLGQFLKLADIVQDGLEAKFMILDGEVEVNGEVELRRGRQLRRFDVITFQGNRYRCE